MIMPVILIFYSRRHYYTDMADMYFMSPDELQAALGKQLQELRIAKN